MKPDNGIKEHNLMLKTLTFAITTILASNIHAATFNNLVENGTFNQPNNTSNTFTNNLTVNGNWNLNSSGSLTDMFFSGAQTIGGSGFINLSNNTANRIYSSANNLLTIGSGLTIQGAGQIGVNQTTFNNLGTVLAQGTNTLTFSTNSFTNNGIFRAEGSGGLIITGSNLTNNTSVDVNAGSKLQLISSSVDGVFNNTLGGTITATGITFDAATINGVMTQANNTSNTITNGLTVNGTWNMNSAGSITDMFFSGAQTIGGTGEIVLSNNTANRIYSTGNNLLTIGNDMTIRGAGQLGVAQTTFDNLGTVLAQGTNALTIRSIDFENNSTLRAEGSGGLIITGTNLTNNTSVDVNAGSKLQLISSSVDGVINNNGGTVTATGITFDAATINGVMTQANNTSNTFTNGLTVNDTWNMNSAGSLTNLFFSGAQTIGGTGEIVLSNNTANRIYSSGNNLLTIGNNMTIRGAGQLGVAQTTFDNQGTVLAQDTNTLTIRSIDFTNNGTLRAEGSGGLIITGSTLNNNTSVDVDNGSKLQLISSTVDGIFNNNGGSMTATGVTFDGATINGEMDQANTTTNTIKNGLTVNGNWNLNSAGSLTNLFFSGAQTIGGTGEIVFSNNSANRIYSTGNNLLTIGNNMTIRGAGQLGIGQTTFDNQGDVLAQGTNTLTIRSIDFTNNGTLHAEGSGGLIITGSTLNNNTSVDVDTGSKLQLISSTVDGIFNNNGGSMTATGVTFDGATINGEMDQANTTTNTIKNGLTVNGSWNLNSTGSLTTMIFSGAQTIGGTGEIVLSNNTANRLYSNNPSNTLTIGSDLTIRGAGQIGLNQTSMVNMGTISGDQSNKLTINTSSFDNRGTLNVTGGGGVDLSGTFTTSGNVNIAAGSTLKRAGASNNFNQTAGHTNVNGILDAPGGVFIAGGLLSGSGLIQGNVSTSGTTGPGNSAGLLSIDGDFTQALGATLDIELGGLTPGSEYDVLNISGDAYLAGVLDVSLIDAFNPQAGADFDILIADSIFGTFDTFNFTSGNGYIWNLQYIVDLNGLNTEDVVRLTLQTSPVPVPASLWLFGSALLGLMGLKRKRRMNLLAS